jgi:hypothetical protein
VPAAGPWRAETRASHRPRWSNRGRRPGRCFPKARRLRGLAAPITSCIYRRLHARLARASRSVHDCLALRGATHHLLRSCWIGWEVCCGTVVGVGEVAEAELAALGWPTRLTGTEIAQLGPCSRRCVAWLERTVPARCGIHALMESAIGLFGPFDSATARRQRPTRAEGRSARFKGRGLGTEAGPGRAACSGRSRSVPSRSCRREHQHSACMRW